MARAADIRAAIKHYTNESAQLGIDFSYEVERAVAWAAENPLAGAPLKRGARRVLLRRFPYQVIYRESPDHIVILAIGHHRRHPDFWLTRRSGG